MTLLKNVQFSFPCNEDINGMTSCGQGKHCKACDRIIIDFRNKSQEEVDSMKKTHQNICGIFSETQVAKGYENYRQLVATTVLAVGLSVSANAQSQEENDPFKSSLKTPKEHVIAGVIIDEKETPTADYPGGIAALRSFFKENIIYPADSVEGKVYVSLTIDTVGRVTNVRIKKSLSPLADAEVVRVAKLMIFNPALVNGKQVNSKISLPCSFSLGKKED